eukprot:4713585-Lingulodinium_polyedra.AAC.1
MPVPGRHTEAWRQELGPNGPGEVPVLSGQGGTGDLRARGTPEDALQPRGRRLHHHGWGLALKDSGACEE